MTSGAKTSPLVVLCLLLASVAHAKESGKPSNFQTSGSADSCPASEKTLLTRRARNIQEGLALEEARTSLIGKGEAQATLEDAKADLAGLIEQEDGQIYRAQARKEKIERRLKDAKAKVDDAKDQGPEKLRIAKAAVDRFKEQAAEARATLEDAKADLAGLIEQEDGEEWPGEKLKKKKDDFVAKAKGRFNRAQATKEKIERKLKDAKAKVDDAKDQGPE
eukprot:CAMPEP_0172777250 /NCGR_PEP_ID=MMETSP1074-20121228/201302_1 /TAXON_ID=2916 /ORGANISM="Ceratium fusus, Strain PA161109" /LENGTH=219 /DNA_ID=CAMNT_0013614163 /DNA_START=31 /DNA_END=688 /DNA_ORIENTATION=-